MDDKTLSSSAAGFFQTFSNGRDRTNLVESESGSVEKQLLPRVRLADSSVIVLNSVLVLGRHPRAYGEHLRERVTLKTVFSAQREVSSTHLELRRSGTFVVVTDLNSTNGTHVTTMWGEYFRLRPGESFVAHSGTKIDIGDRNIIEVL